MKNLILTIHSYDPLVINDAEAIISVVEAIGKNKVKIKVVADKNTAINRGKVYISKKMTESDLNLNGYIHTPLKDLIDENNERMIELLEQSRQRIKFEDWHTNMNIPEKTLKLLAVVGEKGYYRLIELFLAKYLYVNNLELTDEVILEFKKDFLGYEPCPL